MTGRRTYAGLVERMRDAVARYFPPGTRVTRPQGGHVLWVELPGACNHVNSSPVSVRPWTQIGSTAGRIYPSAR